MSTFYGGVVTAKGREVFAQILAARAQLKITDVTFGSGRLPEGTDPRDLTDLVQPVAAGTCSEPNYKGNTVYFTVEYRSDLNGGLSTPFQIREFGIFVRDVQGREVLAYYGSLGDYPQWASAYTPGGPVDVRRYPVGIEIGEGQEVQLEFPSQMFLTSEDVRALCKDSILPEFLAGDVAAALSAHDADEAAHPDLRAGLSGLEDRVTALEDSGFVTLDDQGKIPVSLLPGMGFIEMIDGDIPAEQRMENTIYASRKWDVSVPAESE